MTKTTSIKNFNKSEAISANTKSPIYAKSNTINILMKLFETKMVANSFFGLSSNVTTAFSLLDFDSAALLRSVCESEKNATSAPEINAESISNKKSMTILSALDKKAADKRIDKIVGSGSNLHKFN